MIACIPVVLAAWVVVATAILIIGCLKPRRPAGPCRRRTDAPDDVPALLQEQAD